MGVVEIFETCPTFAYGLRRICIEQGFQVVVFRSSPLEGPSERADMVIVDPRMAGQMFGRFLTGARAVAPVLVTTDAPDPDALAEYRRQGANGAVHRDADVVVIADALRAVALGGDYWPAPAAADGSVDPGRPVLSHRERQVLGQIALGRTHAQVARTLGISQHTVDTYVKRIRSKLRLGNKAELTRAAVLDQHSLI
ncbi:helix-turn-helix transcriptional regulator [Jidongwangia harbinensis]|uniref:helix-turn-helix transcriptional regulator n=1 Tax=Jidongwangia harbinensis TaxID=2878561 RepID=UPI001CDA1A80|nr:response regulator transcription factor [Jidongwangia harbinensis]MCA2211318.1 response regulator transcription factor [Jidongwangia harbinensis]